MMLGQETRQMPCPVYTKQRPIACAWQEVCRWITSLAEGSLPWEVTGSWKKLLATAVSLASNGFTVVFKRVSVIIHSCQSLAVGLHRANDDTVRGIEGSDWLG